MRKIIIISIALILTLPIFAQVTSNKNTHDSILFTLQACIDSAITNNVDIKNASIEIKKAESTKQSAFTNYFPKVSATVGAFKSNRALIDVNVSDIDISLMSSNTYVNDIIQTLKNIYGNSLGIDANIKAVDDGIIGGVTAIQPIFAGRRIYYGNQLAKLGIDASKYQYELKVKDVQVKAEQNFWLIISLAEKSKTIDIVTTLLDTLYKDVSGAVEAGLTMKNDLLKVKLKQNEMQSNKLKLDNGIKLAKMALCQYMGIDYSDNIIFVEPPIKEVVLPADGCNTSYEAINNRLESKLLDINIEAEQFKRKMLVGESLPQFAIGAGYFYINYIGKNNFTGLLFGTLSIPISNWWATTYNLQKQDMATQVAINNKDNLSEMMGLQMQQNWNELEESCKQYSVMQNAIEEAEENLRLANDYYKAGLSTISELLEAQTFMQQCRDNYIETYIQYRIKLSTYYRNK